MAEEHAEGWYTDPYGRHEARWMSRGEATKLVRDGEVESYDAPPDEAPSREMTRIVTEPPPGSDDLRRADDQGGPPTGNDAAGAAVMGALTTWHRSDECPGR